jgi:hypothetical protein
MMIAVVVFGVGAAILLATGGVEGQDAYALAIAAAVRSVVSPVAGWIMATYLRARYERRRTLSEI